MVHFLKPILVIANYYQTSIYIPYTQVIFETLPFFESRIK